MVKARMWLWALLVVVRMVGTTNLTYIRASGAADERHSEWRHHDGQWSYWHEGDKRWYYTDGSHWFYNDGDAWKTYRFDKEFGEDGFERGEY